MLQKGLITNIQLYKWNMVETELCTFCNLERETIIHLLCECHKVEEIWEMLYEWIEDRLGITAIEKSTIAKIKNKLVPNKHNIINTACLIAKQYIYRQRCKAQSLSKSGYMGTLMHFENLEKYIAVKNGKIAKHNKKWNYTAKTESKGFEYIDPYIQEYVYLM